MWQWHCRIPFHFSQFQKFFLPPISTMPLPQLSKIYTSISAMPLPQTFFFFLIATIANFFFFFPIIWFSLHTLTLRASTQAAGMGRRNCGNTIAKNKKFLSYFLSFSLQLLLNFCNGIAAIHSLSSEC